MATMAEKRGALAALAAERDREGRAGRIVRRSVAAIALLGLTMLPVLWALGWFSTPEAVAEVRRLVDAQVAEYDRVARGEVPFALAPSPGAVLEKMRGMPREYREQVGREMGRLWEARERAEMDSYFALPAGQREAELDRRIKAEEERRQRWQAERDQRDRERAANGRQATAGSAGAGGPPGGGSSNAATRRGSTPEAIAQRMKQRLDRTSPDERAQRAEYRRAMEERRARMGQPSGGPRRSG